MNYQEALCYLENISPTGIQLGIFRMEILLKKLGNPEKRLSVIHIAGTNGKGSTSAMLSAILTESGYHTGMYTSPHLVQYNERYSIDGKEISNHDFSKYMEIIKDACDEMVTQNQGQPTVFEILTALGFLYFFQENVDILILEVGLGGRFDATNVITKPLLSIITSIGMDHMDYLGNTLDEISYEKGGIIKKNCPVVLYSQQDLVYNQIVGICRKQNAPLFYEPETNFDFIEKSLDKTVFHIKNTTYAYENLTLSLAGAYQPFNCATVLLACEVLNKKGLAIPENHIRTGLMNVSWAGRMECIQKNPLVLLDGAHNADGIEMLVHSLKDYFESQKITLLLGVLGDKEYEKMARELLPLVDYIVLTEPKNERKLSVDILEQTIQKLGKTAQKNCTISEALPLALKHTKKDGVLLCCGSLYMIGEIRKLMIYNGGILC